MAGLNISWPSQLPDNWALRNLADHLWFAYTHGFEKAGIKEGDRVEFDARIKELTKLM